MHYLTNHGIKNVGCSPRMDRQSIISPTRITTRFGAKRIVSLKWLKIRLPDNENRYLCYLIGEIPRTRFGIDNKIFTNKWYDIKTLMEENDVIYNFYSGAGMEVSRDRIQVKLLNNGGFVLIIRLIEYPEDYLDKTLFMRTYKNSFFETNRIDPTHIKIELETIETKEATEDEIIDFINNHNSKNRRGYGAALACFNGIWWRNLSQINLARNNLIDSLFDGSIREILEFRVNDLKSFTSIKDEKRKYLIHVDKQFDNNITYFDDLDFLVGDRVGTEYTLGIRIPRNKASVIRQITHNDYSILVDAVEEIGRKYYGDNQDLYLKIVTRESGYDRALWYVEDRIRALYKLNDEQIKTALLGIDSNVEFWRADYLENGSYVGLMSKDANTVKLEDVVECYGYRGIAKANSNTPVIVNDNIKSAVEIPIQYRANCLVIEYSREGTVEYFTQLTDKTHYPIQGTDCGWVEFFKGVTGRKVYTGYNTKSFKIDTAQNNRFFKKDTDKDWIDVTDGGEYTIKGNEVTWDIDIDNIEVCTLSDNDIYNELGDLTYYKYHFPHTLKVDISPDESDEKIINATLNFNHYMVWLNGKALIRDVDFKIKNEILFIVNKEFLNPRIEDKNEIRIVASGNVLNSWLEEKGYVRDDLVSCNGKYDYYEDRLLRVVNNGKVYPLYLVRTAEESSKVDNVILRNGSPYTIENINPGLKDPEIDYDNLIKRTLAKEKELEDYLTIKLPETIEETLDDIENYHLLYSPFISIIIYEMNDDRTFIPDGRVTDEQIDKIVNPYKYLLEFDPSLWNLDYSLISIHPHPYRYTLTVTQKEFSILERINEIYLKNVADLSPFLQVTDEPNNG